MVFNFMYNKGIRYYVMNGSGSQQSRNPW